MKIRDSHLAIYHTDFWMNKYQCQNENDANLMQLGYKYDTVLLYDKSEKQKKRGGYDMKYVRLLTILLLTGGILYTAEASQADSQPSETVESFSASYKNVNANEIFHIYHAKDFDTFLTCVENGMESLDAVLEADIEAGEISDNARDYAGNFNGQGHKISGMRQELFSTLKKEGVIENLTIETDISSEKGKDSGGITLYNYGCIKDCEVYGTITAYNYTGGITAFNFGLIQCCRNYAAVTSLETGETWEYKNWMSGYGAGGIAGSCATDQEKEYPDICVIIYCDNYGEVTAMSYAGGIVAHLEDKTSENAPANSVQELVQNSSFATPSEQWKETEDSESVKEDDGKHYSLLYCRNYGTVTAVNRVDPRTYWYTQPAGICSDLSWGDIKKCANLGRVQFDPAAPKYSEDGYVHTNCPMAITYNMGFAPTKEHHIIDCVNLKGTIKETMRHENIMELSKEEISAWENGTYQREYISNNWKFDLEEAVTICELSLLNVKKNQETALAEKKNYYLCNEFMISLPEYMKIEECILDHENASGCYALHITIQQNSACEDMDGKEECWIMRKDADVKTAKKEADEANTNDAWRDRYFYEELFQTISPYYYMKISTLNLPFHNCYQGQKYRTGTLGERLFVESAIPNGSLSDYMQEGSHTLGNVIAMPLYENAEGETEAKWILVFNEKDSNIHPTRFFIDTVEAGFYPLKSTDQIHVVKAGDNLWKIARSYTLDPWNWKLIAEINGIETPDHIEVGDVLIIPSIVND